MVKKYINLTLILLLFISGSEWFYNSEFIYFSVNKFSTRKLDPIATRIEGIGVSANSSFIVKKYN